MKQRTGVLTLEVLFQKDALAMSIFESGEVSPTLKHYSQRMYQAGNVEKICAEVAVLVQSHQTEALTGENRLENLKKLTRILFDSLLTKSVKERLVRESSGPLILLIDEELVSIPWELLFDGNDFLCLKFALGRIVRTRQQLPEPQYRFLETRQKMLILSNPTGDLPWAYREGIRVKTFLEHRRNRVSVDFKSTSIDTLYVKKNLREYDIVHFAGHCQFEAGNHRKSGWVLNDGHFSAADVMALGESGNLPHLVFSNACDSARLAHDGGDQLLHRRLYSIAQAFLFSGTRHYIGSIKKIEDAPAGSFAGEFYNHVMAGCSVGESIRLARLHDFGDHNAGACRWASYIMYGDPNFSLFARKSQRQFFLKTCGRSIRHNRLTWLRAALIIFILIVSVYGIVLLPTRNSSAYILLTQARKFLHEGKNSEALASARAAVERDPYYLAIYPSLTETYRRSGDFTAALRTSFDYALHAQKQTALRHVAAAYIDIGWLYQQKGDYPKAIEFYQKALAVSREHADKLHEAVALRKIAVWYIDKEEDDEALRLLTQSAEINRERAFLYDHRYNLACDYFDIGLVFENKDDYKTAREFYAKSAGLFAKLQTNDELGDYYFNMGEIALFEKQYQKALRLYQQGLSCDESIGNLPSVAGDYNMLGDLYQQMGDWGKAHEYYGRAAALAERIDVPLERAGAYYSLALLYKEKKDFPAARDYFRKAQEIYRTIDLPNYQRIKEEFRRLTSPVE